VQEPDTITIYGGLTMDKELEEVEVSRFEVIDHTITGAGRDFVKYAVSVKLSYQDDGRALKVLLEDSKS
tara:strand:- start:674 stop:880 length:207 start_codon:yes stop_codon:yes gene_type:complete